jgi:hypothetical protein
MKSAAFTMPYSKCPMVSVLDLGPMGVMMSMAKDSIQRNMIVKEQGYQLISNAAN